MLDDLYNFIKNSKSNPEGRKITKESNKARLESFLISKINSNKKYSIRSNEIGVNYIKNVLKKPSIVSKSQFDDVSDNLSDVEIKYINELNSILTSDEDVITKISSLESKIKKETTLNDKQLITLYSATQTARYSYNYWTENIEN